MLTINYSTRFKKDYKLVKKRGYDIGLLEEVLEILCAEQPLPQKYRDHALTGNYDGHRECHITPNWLLIYEVAGDGLILYLTRTGTHSDVL
ncbi:MAG: type II toxin-antitoxin system YafQ family toxin [Clostridiales bacterium]|jgi:mRNA interferase YafQ|nr:type II toxin-antitoxin system YafQ family toxin [Clostridiales bacterium]